MVVVASDVVVGVVVVGVDVVDGPDNGGRCGVDCVTTGVVFDVCVVGAASGFSIHSSPQVDLLHAAVERAKITNKMLINIKTP